MSNPIQTKSITLEEVQSLLSQATGKGPDPDAVARIIDRIRQRLMLEVWLYARDYANRQIKAAAKAARETRAHPEAS